MTTPLAGRLDALGRWRSSLLLRLDGFSRFLIEHDLSEASGAERIAALRERIASDKVVVALVAEFSRGKSELINAVFFADTGRRVLPAAPGRTTMCPVELGYEPDVGQALALLPIESRLDGATIADLRSRAKAWTHIPLEGVGAERLAEAVAQVVRTQWVAQDKARALGFWDDERREDNPPVDADGRVEIPVWRHALINYRHPLLERGLVVLDTPGLNALGAEPELTLGLLSTAQATVFVLGADAGLTRSDMALWREHLAPRSLAHFVLLNKIDALRDPMLPAAPVASQVEALCHDTARVLGIAPQCVFGVSARDALIARVNGDEHGLRGSGLLEFEDALGSQLLNQRCELLQGVVDETVRLLQVQAAHRVGEMRRQLAEQTLELRGLRGKSALRLRAARERMAAEAVEFEQCVVQLQALRAVHNRMMSATLVGLASDPLRAELSRMRDEIQASMLGLGARKAFVALCARLRERILTAQSGSNEIHAMLSASYRPLNARHGLGLVLAPPPALQRFAREIDMLETGYLPKLGLAHSLRRPQAQFTEQFMRMLVSRIRGIFETASTDIESWNRAASTHVDHQLGERRRNFSQRNEALQRIELAAGELERRIVDLGAHDVTLRGCQAHLGELAQALRTLPPPEAPPGRHVAKSSASQAPRRRAMA